MSLRDSSTYFPSFVELWVLFYLFKKPFCLGLCLKTRKRFVASNANQETIGISSLLSLSCSKYSSFFSYRDAFGARVSPVEICKW